MLIVRRIEGSEAAVPAGTGSDQRRSDQWLAMLRQALTANYDRLDEVLATMNTNSTRSSR